VTVEQLDDLLPWADPEFRRDPYPRYRVLQRDHPICLVGGEYIVSRYDDVLKFGKMPCMSVRAGWEDAGPWVLSTQTVLGSDLPHHTALRRQTNRWLTPKLVKQWVEPTAALTREVLDGIGADGTIEAWYDLVAEVTHRIMCRILQVPEDGSAKVVDAMFDAMKMLSAAPRDGDVELARECFAFLFGRVDEFIELKRTTPGDGLADALLGAAAAGEIAAEEARATILMFYMLGHMDVGYSIASGLELFARRPDVFDAYRAEPDGRQAIINEIIRIDPPELSLVRYPTEDVEIHGVPIAAGSSVRFMIAAANRDPDVFENPDEFDHHRPPEASRSLSFGLGIHSCAGQVVARAETAAIFDTIAERYARIELASQPEMENNDFARFYKQLPLKFIPHDTTERND
jgi:cytochrome P450